MGITAAITGAAVAVGSTAYSIVNSNNQQKNAQNLANEQQAANQQEENQAQQQMQNQESNSAMSSVEATAANSQRAAAASAQGENSTILTSPLGVTSQAPTQGQKTLLGT